MKRVLAGTLIILVLGLPLMAQEDTVDRLAVPLSNPGEIPTLGVSLVNGSIDVEAYDGQEIIVEARTRTRIGLGSSGKKAEGMIRIPVNTTGLTVTEDDNKVVVEVESWKRTIDVRVQVPRKCHLKLHTVNSGDISVTGVEGELEVNNVNGKVTLDNVGGALTASTLNGDLKATMKLIYPDKPMAFSNLNGDIDITFPGNLKADVQLQNDNGDIFSDFEIDIQAQPKKVVEKDNRESEGRYRVRVDRTIYGKINGGGPEYRFKNFQGDILIRRIK